MQKRSENKISYLEVRKSQLSPDSLINGPYETSLSGTRNDSAQDLHEKSLLVTKMLAELHQLEPNPRLNAALQFGKEMIISALKGSSYIPEVDNMRVVFLAPDDYRRLRAGGTSGGVMIPGIDVVFVQVDTQHPDFFTASKAFHELIHRWVDKQYHVFHSEVDVDSDTRKTFFDIRRVGLMIKRIVKVSFTGEVIDSEFFGELLNELGSFAWQSVFIERIQNDKEMKLLFGDEFSFRDKKLEDMFGDSKAGSVTVEITDENGTETTVNIDSKNLFWDNTGKIEVSSTTLIMQLVDDLSHIVGDVGQLNFKSVLVSLKTRPEQQVFLKNAVDSKLGEGFYSKLRRTSYHTLSSLLSILAEVQSHFT